jgi:hypothetical protein
VSGGDALARLASLLRRKGGLVATLVDVDRAGDGDALARAAPSRDPLEQSPGALVAQGPRAAAQPEEYELLVEAIYEGYLVHYGAPRVLRTGDPDLRLLAGDQLYAIGLARLVRLGDSEAVAELADTITLSALAHGSGQPALAAAVWQAGARAVGWGSSDAHRRAKDLAFEGSHEAIAAMRTSAGEERPAGRDR